MKKIKNRNWFITILEILFICYLGMYFSCFDSIYENKKREEVTLTNENIKKFEEDVKNNKNIDINNYVVKNTKDYNGFMSTAGEKVSYFVENLMTKETGKVVKLLKKCFFNSYFTI